MQPYTLVPPLRRATIGQWFTNPFVQTLTTSESLGWKNVTVHSASLDATHDFSFAPQLNDDVLILVLEGSAYTEGYVAGRLINMHAVAGTLITYPRGYEVHDSRWDSSVNVILVELSHQGIMDIAASTVARDPETVELSQVLGFHDPLLHHLGIELYRELQNRSLFGPLFAESVASTITLHLLRKYSNVAVRREVRAGKLPPGQSRIVDEYIQANLHQKISLADLAQCIHVSVPHFEKMFRATFGCPPYRYVLQRRIDRAKALLCHTRLSLYEVARDCGFANQGHFTRHFTRFVGVSPARFIHSAGS